MMVPAAVAAMPKAAVRWWLVYCGDVEYLLHIMLP